MSAHLREAWGALTTEAMPSWRAQGTDYWNDFDCVISTDANGRGRNFEVYTYGKQWATRHSIADAKASVEEVYGPLTWRRVQLPTMSYDHYYFGEIGEEMTDPHSILVTDLPKLGKLASAFSPSVVASWKATQPWNADRADLEAQNIPGVVVGHARGTEDASYEGGHIVLKEQWFGRSSEVRKAILYHEAGHALEDSFTLSDFQRLGIDSPLDLIDWPGAQSLGGSYTEVLAEAYSALWCDPGWFARTKASRLRDLVTTMAHERGFPLP